MNDTDYWQIDPAEVLDYAFDWSSFLLDGETITGQTATGDGLTVDQTTRTGEVVTVWLSNGVPGDGAVACTITTSQGRTIKRTRRVLVATR